MGERQQHARRINRPPPLHVPARARIIPLRMVQQSSGQTTPPPMSQYDGIVKFKACKLIAASTLQERDRSEPHFPSKREHVVYSTNQTVHTLSAPRRRQR